MDIIDIAQKQQEKEMKALLAQRRLANNVTNQQSSDGNYYCIDCDNAIPTQRVKLGFTVRCVTCQQELERK